MILRVVIVSLIADYSEIVNYCANITVGKQRVVARETMMYKLMIKTHFSSLSPTLQLNTFFILHNSPSDPTLFPDQTHETPSNHLPGVQSKMNPHRPSNP